VLTSAKQGDSQDPDLMSPIIKEAIKLTKHPQYFTIEDDTD
jgi:hypothetical protein